MRYRTEDFGTRFTPQAYYRIVSRFVVRKLDIIDAGLKSESNIFYDSFRRLCKQFVYINNDSAVAIIFDRSTLVVQWTSAWSRAVHGDGNLRMMSLFQERKHPSSAAATCSRSRTKHGVYRNGNEYKSSIK